MDRELVRSAMAGDREAFDVLASASIGRLYAVAALILRDPDRAADATQEALVTCLA
jgi:DNA-directed RNA polymerase specialized sigma24 family protein